MLGLKLNHVSKRGHREPWLPCCGHTDGRIHRIISGYRAANHNPYSRLTLCERMTILMAFANHHRNWYGKYGECLTSYRFKVTKYYLPSRCSISGRNCELTIPCVRLSPKAWEQQQKIFDPHDDCICHSSIRFSSEQSRTFLVWYRAVA